MPKFTDALVEKVVENGVAETVEPGAPLTPDEVAAGDFDHKVDDALTARAWVNYLLSRKGKQRLGQRKSFSNNAIAAYLANQLGGEWLVTPQSAMYAETMQSYALPDWMRQVLTDLSQEKDAPDYVDRDAATRYTLTALAEWVTADQEATPVLE